MLNTKPPSFQKKRDLLTQKFTCLPDLSSRYEAVIELGKKLPPFPEEERKKENLVTGCQSTLYVQSQFEAGKLYLNATSDALISKGLAALLIYVYQEEPPETLLKNPPLYLKELQVIQSLSLNRSQGLLHIYLHLKQEALKSLSRTA